MKRVLFASLFFCASMALTAFSQPPPGQPKDKKGPEGKKKGPPRYELGKLFPPFVREGLNLSKEQEKQLADLEAEVKEKLNKILTDEQKKKVETLRPQGGPGGGGPGGPGGPGGGGPGGPGGGARQATNNAAKPSFGSGKENPPAPVPEGLKSIGGRWYVKGGIL